VSRRERLALAALLLAFFSLATVYNVVSPPFEAPDEVGHFYFIVYLLETGDLPVVPATTPPPNFEQEGMQAPLYYWSSSLLVRALAAPLQLDLSDVSAPIRVNPFSTCGQPQARYNVNYFDHNMFAERLPYQGRIRVLHVVRLWSSFLGTLTVAGVFVAARLAFPGIPRVSWIAAVLTAFTPEFLFTAGAVNNDNMVTALATWGVVLALSLVRNGISWPCVLGMGVLAGLAGLSKLAGSALLPLSLLAIAFAVWKERTNKQRGRWWLFGRTCLIGAPVIAVYLLLMGWWIWRNLTLYGDLTGIRAHLVVMPARDTMSVWILIRELPGLFQSWWGTFGCTAPPMGFYGVYLVVSLGALAGLIAAHRSLREDPLSTTLLLVWLGLLGAAYVQWNWLTAAPKGRLLYPAMVSVSILLARGAVYWTARWRSAEVALLVLLAACAIAVPVAVIAPRVTPPPVYADPEQVQPDNLLAGRFGSSPIGTVALLGYDTSGSSFEPGEWIELVLYWQALNPPSEHLTLAVQLVSVVPEDTSTLVNFNTWTGGGTYPTGHWRPGDIIADSYRLQIPAVVDRAQAWRVQVILFHGDARLPYTLNNQPAGDAAFISLVRVGASSETVQMPAPDEGDLQQVVFGESIAFDGVEILYSADELEVQLRWSCLAALDHDYAVFVHLYDAAGSLLTTGDGPPLAGGFPTSLWQPGDSVVDTHSVTAMSRAAVKLGIGWYDVESGARLDAVGVDGQLEDNVLIVPLE